MSTNQRCRPTPHHRKGTPANTFDNSNHSDHPGFPAKGHPMNPYQFDKDDYFEQILKLLARRLGRMIQRGEVRVQEADDITQYFCEWLLNRPKLMEVYSPAAIVSVATKQRFIEFIRAQHRQSPLRPFDANAIDKSMFMEYLDQAGWGPSGFAPTHAVPAKDFEDGDNDSSEGLSLIEKLDSGVDVARDNEHQMMTQAMLKALNPMQREVFMLVNLEGYSVTDAARKMGIRRERASIALGHAQKIVDRLRDDWDV
jgi:RNA polymerase sigma factor (sigma-70 family)